MIKVGYSIRPYCYRMGLSVCLFYFSGIGHHIAIRLDSLGFVVFAGCLDSEGDGATKLRSSSSGRMHVLQMDITNDDDVMNACNYVSETCKGAGNFNSSKLL